MFSSKTTLRVRYAETDRMGYVYYGNYAQYFEVGRVEALRQLGYSYKEIEDSGVILPVVDLQVKFKKPALYDDELTITTFIKELPSVRIRFEYEVRNQNDELICTGETSLVFVDPEKNKPCRAPEGIVEALRTYIKDPI